MNESLKFYKLIYKIPNPLVRGVEDMRSVLVYKNTIALLTVAVSTYVRALIYYQNTLACLVRTMRRYGTK